jgi:hypothetical protein
MRAVRRTGECARSPSADTPDGPTLGLATRPLPAVHAALECFDELRPELMRDLARTVDPGRS